MARLVCIHEVELSDGVDPAEFERVFAEGSGTEPPGWKIRLLKGDRGRRAGKYAYLVEIESVEARDRYFPEDGVRSEEGARWDAEHPEGAEHSRRLGALQAGEDVGTDYLVVAE